MPMHETPDDTLEEQAASAAADKAYWDRKPKCDPPLQCLLDRLPKAPPPRTSPPSVKPKEPSIYPADPVRFDRDGRVVEQCITGVNSR